MGTAWVRVRGQVWDEDEQVTCWQGIQAPQNPTSGPWLVPPLHVGTGACHSRVQTDVPPQNRVQRAGPDTAHAHPAVSSVIIYPQHKLRKPG